MALTWLTGLAALGMFLSPECRMTFAGYAWESRQCRAGTLIPKLEFFFLYPFIMGTFLIYLTILAMIAVKKRSTSTVSVIPASFEWSILGLTGLRFAGGVLLGVFYNLYKGVFPGEPLIAASTTCVIICLNGVDPIFLLSVNK
ncbi:hypothetical protein AAVH_10636 [Aphelenchoides avenae]|nr:hypothetical protein AAVH_39456 [Aphelenchus avenae]KAH7721789.1 hypothetical protein AAVH_10636 [Aphelenchus avenae]